MKKLILSLAILGFGSFSYAQKKMPQKKDANRETKIQQKRAQHRAEMQKDLNLTPQQMAELDAMQDKRSNLREQRRQEMQEQRKAKMAMRKKDSQQRDDEMRRVLTPEQYQKWKAKQQERSQSRHDKMMKDRERPRPGSHKKHPKPERR